MLLSSLIFFLLSEIIFLTKLSGFWCFILIVFAFFIWRRSASADFKKISVLMAPALFLILNLVLHRLYDFSWWGWQLHIVLLAGFFYLILYCHSQPERFPVFFQIFPLFGAGLVGFLFFRSNLFADFFWKEVLLLFGTFIILESDRRVILNLKKAEDNSNNFLWSVIPAVIFLELAWLFNFLPINFLSLAGIWLILLYLWREFVFLFFRRLFNWRQFLPQLALALIIVAMIMFTSGWKII